MRLADKQAFHRYAHSLLWTACVVGLGLLQLWIVVLIGALRPSLPFRLDAVVKEGVLLFFVTALVAHLAVEHHLEDRRSRNRWIETILFFMYPIVVVILVCAGYALLYLSGMGDLDMKAATDLSIALSVSAVVYAFMVKVYSPRRVRK